MKKCRTYNDISARSVTWHIKGDQYISLRTAIDGNYTGVVFDGTLSDLTLNHENRYIADLLDCKLRHVSAEGNIVVIGIDKD